MVKNWPWNDENPDLNGEGDLDAAKSRIIDVCPNVERGTFTFNHSSSSSSELSGILRWVLHLDVSPFQMFNAMRLQKAFF